MRKKKKKKTKRTESFRIRTFYWSSDITALKGLSYTVHPCDELPHAEQLQKPKQLKRCSGVLGRAQRPGLKSLDFFAKVLTYGGREHVHPTSDITVQLAAG